MKNIYKDPKTGRKIGTVSPALSLGSAVHEVLEGLAKYKAEVRAFVPVFEHYEKAWEKFAGKKGGFNTQEEENETKARGRAMIEMVKNNMAPLLAKTVKLKESKNGMPPNYFLSEEENIILCGKIDWLIWNTPKGNVIENYGGDDKNGSIHILDFKTGKNEENEDSLQLPIYQLLLKELQKRKVSGASYWYLDKDTEPREMNLPDLEESYERVMVVARGVKALRESGEFLCKNGPGGCFACKPFEKIVRGEAEYVGKGDWQDLYMV